MIDAHRQTSTVMGTVVTMEVISSESSADQAKRQASLARAFEWFHRIEASCTRFDPDSELLRLSASVGEATEASPVLFEAVRFALAVAADTAGAFDPTIGHLMESRGFDREYRTGRAVRTEVGDATDVTYRDVEVDVDRRTVRLRRPLVLDLGAVAKGMAIDMAAAELREFGNFAIDAGGDLYVAGTNRRGEPWTIGLRHPRRLDEVIESIVVSDTAVCTSGDYLRRMPGHPDGHHILVPQTGQSATGVASVTVIAPTAMLADALATAAFVLGPVEGIRLLERHGVEGVMLSPDLDRFATQGMGRDSTILSDAEGPVDHRTGSADQPGHDRLEPGPDRGGSR